MTRKVCALAETTVGQVPPVLPPISATLHFKDFVLLVIRNLCNDGLIGTGAFPAILGLWRQPPGNPAFHPSFQRCWSTSSLRRKPGRHAGEALGPTRTHINYSAVKGGGNVGEAILQ